MSVTQFVKVALIGTDGNIVTFSPVSEGVEGASKTLFVTEAGEEIKVEDDQTVLTSVRNVITIVATCEDAEIATINSWATNETYVGFAGYTIGGLAYAPAISGNSVSFTVGLENGADTAFVGNRADVFQVSSVQQLNNVKHIWRIVLTQTCLQSYGPVTGILSGVTPNSDILKACTVNGRFSETKTGTGNFVLPYQSYVSAATAAATYTPSGIGYRISLPTITANILSRLFFPFDGTLTLSATGSRSSTGAFTGNNVTMRTYQSNGTNVVNSGFSLATTASSTGTVSVSTYASTPYMGVSINKSDIVSGFLNIDDIRLTFTPV